MTETCPCPQCGTDHAAGKYVRRTDLSDDRAPRYLPADVTCRCGRTLRYTVPIFNVANGGFYWSVVSPTARSLADELAELEGGAV